MEESEHSKTNKKCIPQTRSFRGKNCNPHNYQYHYHHQLYHHHHHSNTTRFNGFYYQNQYQNYPALLPLPQTIPFQVAPPPLLSQYQNFSTKPHVQKPLLNYSIASNTTPLATSSEKKASDLAITTGKVDFLPFCL